MHVYDFTNAQISSKYVHNNILIIAKMRLNLTNLRIEMYPTEGPMLKALVAPFTRVVIVCWSKSWTTVDAGRCSPRSPSGVH